MDNFFYGISNVGTVVANLRAVVARAEAAKAGHADATRAARASIASARAARAARYWSVVR